LVKIFSQSKEYIVNSVKNGDVTIAVYGLGNIGLPIAVLFAYAGAKVIGVDIDKDRVELINEGICYIENEPNLKELFEESYKIGRISATTDLLKGSRENDVKIITVPTLLTSSKTLDLSALEIAAEYIGKGLSKKDMIILESSVPPGTTEGMIKDTLERYS
jgi:nucleotide sugar dehydrogenase